VTRGEFCAATGLSYFQLIREFGGYNGLLQAAGFPPHLDNQKISDDDLMRSLRDACLAQGGILSQTAFNKATGNTGSRFRAYHRRWGRWPNVLVALRRWVERNDPDFLFRADLPRADAVADPRLHRAPPPSAAGRARRYGAPLNFRGVLHEPVNELGVILLFGCLADELGFAVEKIQAGFPDCEAKRRTGFEGWEWVRIEFEFESRNFKTHNHDPRACDLIVCWTNNWPESPVEVLELKQEVARLTSQPVIPDRI
jgi:hypothetical protein